MKKSRALLLIIALLMLIPTGVLTGCGGGESNAIQGMKWLPTGKEYVYVDVAASREPEYSTIYRTVVSQFSELAEYGISWDDVSWFATGSSAVMLFGGNFDFNEIRGKLDELGNKNSYRGVEIWTGLGWEDAIVLRNGLVIAGDGATVYESIDVIEGREQSLYDNRDLREILGRLPQTAAFIRAATGGESFPTDITSLDAVAVGFEVIDAQTMACMYVGKFRDVTSASGSLSAFESWSMKQVTYSQEHVQVIQEGEFIKVTGTYPMSEIETE